MPLCEGQMGTVHYPCREGVFSLTGSIDPRNATGLNLVIEN